jgi:transcription initiation factor IIE alpha subunit
MRIKRITSQSRRDFNAIYQCENCGNEQKGYGYDDANFHDNVIPKMKCSKCGEASGKITSSASIPAWVVL